MNYVKKSWENLLNNNDEDKVVNGRKMCAKKRKFKFEHYKNCFEAAQIENKLNHFEKKQN